MLFWCHDGFLWFSLLPGYYVYRVVSCANVVSSAKKKY